MCISVEPESCRFPTCVIPKRRAFTSGARDLPLNTAGGPFSLDLTKEVVREKWDISYCAGSSSSNISDNAAPAGTIGYTFASGAQSNTSNSGPCECKKPSIRSPV
jgi:hypothetical protein